MIRVLQVVKRMDRGGLETFIMNVYRGIDRSIIQFDFLTHSQIPGAYDEEIMSLGGKIFRITSRRENLIRNHKELNAFFENHPEYTIIHMHESSMLYISPLVIARKHGVLHTILHSRNNNITSGIPFVAMHRINQILYKRCIEEKYAISKEAAIWMFGNKDYERGNVKILKNGITSSSFVFNETDRKLIRNDLGIGDEEIVIGNIGRLSKQKNQLFLVNVFEDLHKQNKRYRLVIIGDGDERGAIESYIDSHELSKAVILLSNRSDVNRYYNAFDFFALPSLFEGLGRVLLEAQCNGLPCFASKGTIANEVKVLSTFKFVELNSKESWVDTIISSPCHREKDAEKEIVSAGYEIRNTIDYLQKHYVEMGAT